MRKLAKILIIGILFIVTGCYDEEQFPDTPRIEFRSLEFIDSPNSSDSLVLSFHFEDGDANLGTTPNDFIPRYALYVDSEPKILTEGNLDEAVPPIFQAPVYFENLDLVQRDQNIFTVLGNSNSFPAILDNTVFSNSVDDIVFECPDLINQNLGLFDTTNVKLYEVVQPDTSVAFFLYNELLTQNINSVVPAEFLETYYNFVIQFESIVNGEVQVIDFREVLNETDCSLGNFNARIPLFDDEGRSGTITYNIISLLLKTGIRDDPFQVRFYVYDRAGNRSNEVVSPPFLLRDITRN